MAAETRRARSVSYAAVLQPASPRASKKNLEDVGEDFKQATIYNDKPGIFYTEEEVASMAEPYRFALVGKFSGLRPKPQEVLQAFRNLGLSGFYNIRFLRSGYIFMHLSTSEDMARIWTRGIWYIGGVSLRIFKWTPNFSYTVESSVVPVWIQFPDLPIHMFNKKGLFSAAKIVGTPIKIDEATADCSRLTMALVCVEIDLLKPRIEEFWIGIGEEKRLQKVVYERVPNYCKQCCHLGHTEEECYANGNRPKPQRKAGKEDGARGGEDLRVRLNRKYAAGNDKGTVNTTVEPREEVQKKNGGETQIWTVKKGNSKAQEQEKTHEQEQGNRFQVLNIEEEEDQVEVEEIDGGARRMSKEGEEYSAESINKISRQGTSKLKVVEEEEQVEVHYQKTYC
ncbi:uncharacterized protein LOC141821603 [Curcuma longa]|uniref:uncharacterized protein LOC141821603 n=1 Tax=Curcuma longa TaxID=136217 RepID=UPI003D9EF907